MESLKYCLHCRAQYVCGCKTKTCMCHACDDEGRFDPETVSIRHAKKIQAELHSTTKIHNEWTKAFWERMKETIRG